MDMSRPGDVVARPCSRRIRAPAAASASIDRELGHEVSATVMSEADAVSAAALQAPDLMVVDLQPAPGDGASAMRATAMPHVFMTGSRYALPADATVLLKPFGEFSLIEALERDVRDRPRCDARFRPRQGQSPALDSVKAEPRGCFCGFGQSPTFLPWRRPPTVPVETS